MTTGLRIAVVLLIVLGNAFFVAAEYALVTARRSRLRELADDGSLRARIALRIMDSPVRFIGTVQLGITLFSIMLGAIGEPLVEHFLDPFFATTVSFLISFVIVTYLHVTLGELVPKAIALQKNESTALWVALPVEAFYVVTYPLVWTLQESANSITRLFGINPAPAGVVAHTEEDIRHIVAEAEDTGILEEAEEEMVYKVFDFAEKEAHEVMVPRPQVVALSVDLPPQEALAAVIDSPYTRYPVYRDSLDNVLGLLHVRDLFKALYAVGVDEVKVEDLVRPGLRRPRDEGPGRAPAGVPRPEPAHGDRRGRVRQRGRDRHARGSPRGDRGRDRGRVRPAGRVGRAGGRAAHPHRRHVPDRRLQRAVRPGGAARGLPHGRGLRLRPLGRAAEEGDKVEWNGLCFSVIETDGKRIGRLEVEFPEPEPAEAVAEA